LAWCNSSATAPCSGKLPTATCLDACLRNGGRARGIEGSATCRSCSDGSSFCTFGISRVAREAVRTTTSVQRGRDVQLLLSIKDVASCGSRRAAQLPCAM
jgi:hypothetical protein